MSVRRLVVLLTAMSLAWASVPGCGDAVSVEPAGPPAPGGAGGQGGEEPMTSSTSSGPELIEPSSCPEGQFVTAVSDAGELTCAPLDPARIQQAVGNQCEVYLGWRDDCSDCDNRPKKWGQVNSGSCTLGRGEDNSCIEAQLGSSVVPMFGLNTNGDVSGDDKFYVGVHCSGLGESGHVGPCAEGEFVRHVAGGSIECVSADHLYVDYVQDKCSVYLGWRDNCEGCNADPAKWGRMRGNDCLDGAGDDNICFTPFLWGRWVSMFGLNTDGDVDGNDSFYFGWHCEDATVATAETGGPCPAGTLMSGITAERKLVCTAPAAVVQDTVRSSCSLYGGWRDSCDGCFEPPSKWGRAAHGVCEIGAGDDNGCIEVNIEGQKVSMLGINTDGDVNGDDKFFVGWQCYQPEAPPN